MDYGAHYQRLPQRHNLSRLRFDEAGGFCHIAVCLAPVILSVTGTQPID
jgi:hypothetical protein